MEIVERLPPLVEVQEDGSEVVVVEENETIPAPEDDVSYEVLDNSALNTDEKINWDNEVQLEDGSWAEWRKQEAVTIGNVTITNEEAAAGISAVALTIIIIVAICCFISFLERKKIAAEARSASITIRNSIRRMTGADPDKDLGEPEAPKTAEEIAKMAKENASNKQEKVFLNDMFTEQYKDNDPEKQGKVEDPIEGLPG